MTDGPGDGDELPVPGPWGPRWSRQVARFLAHGVWRTRIVGAEHVPGAGPVLLACNHVSVVDGPLLLGASPRPLHILVKKEMYRGAFGPVLRAAGQIPVDRGRGRPALVAALRVLERGGAVGIFPEGNRGRGDVASARAGVAWLALGSGAPVVPVACLGTRRTGEGVGHVPGFRRRVLFEFGEPVWVGQEPGQPRRAALERGIERVRFALADLVARASERTGLRLPENAPARG